MYHESATAGNWALPESSVAAHGANATSSIEPRASDADGVLRADDGMMFDHAFEDDLAEDDTLTQFFGGNGGPIIDLGIPQSLLNESLTLDEVLLTTDHASNQHQTFEDVTMTPYDKLGQKSGSWCEWMHKGVSLSVVTEKAIAEPNSNLLATFQDKRPHAQHNADIIIQSLRSFPTMMLRRETFPWFIHPLSHLLSKQAGATLPEALSSCMSIVQMFASRTPETKHLLSRAIRIEYRRFLVEVRVLPGPRCSIVDHQKRCTTCPTLNSLLLFKPA